VEGQPRGYDLGLTFARGEKIIRIQRVSFSPLAVSFPPGSPRGTVRTLFEPSELLPESLKDRSHGVNRGSIGQFLGIVTLVV
jgi:hypothetical protein